MLANIGLMPHIYVVDLSKFLVAPKGDKEIVQCNFDLNTFLLIQFIARL